MLVRNTVEKLLVLGVGVESGNALCLRSVLDRGETDDNTEAIS